MTTHGGSVDGRWTCFIDDHLLKGGAVTGTCLLSHQGMCLYSMGLLEEFHKTSRVKQFLGIFNLTQRRANHQLTVPVTGYGVLNFQVNKETNCSLYAASSGSHIGLLVGNLPYGVLVCTYTHREPEIARARRQFEHVCSLLRS